MNKKAKSKWPYISARKNIISKVLFKYFTRAIIDGILKITNSTPVVIRQYSLQFLFRFTVVFLFKSQTDRPST